MDCQLVPITNELGQTVGHDLVCDLPDEEPTTNPYGDILDLHPECDLVPLRDENGTVIGSHVICDHDHAALANITA